MEKTRKKQETILSTKVLDPFYNANNMKRLEKSIDDLEKGRGSKHELIEEE